MNETYDDYCSVLPDDDLATADANNDVRCPPKDSGELIDPNAKLLHRDAEQLYLRANEAYQRNASRVYQRICIHSGRRPVMEQVALYRKHLLHKEFGGPSVPPANNPGYSPHEYGLAIDIIRSGDEALLKAALEGAGWEQHSNPSERHHYSAKGIESWREIERKRGEILQKYFDMKELIADHIRADIGHTELVEKLRDEQLHLARVRTRLRAAAKEVERQQRKVNELKDHLDVLEIEARIIQDELLAAERELRSFKYTTCPDKNPLEDCISDKHKPQRDEYFRKRASLEREVDSVRRTLQDHQRKISRQLTQIESAERQMAIYEDRRDMVQVELDDQEKLVYEAKKSVTDARHEMARKFAAIGRYAARIQAEIDEYLNGVRLA